MAFTFQINHDIAFVYEQKLLKKAEQNKPVIRIRKETPVQLVELTEDSSKLGGCGMEKSSRRLKEISSYGLKRDDALILDFGEHKVGRFGVGIHAVGSPMDAPLYLRLRFAEVPAELAGSTENYDGWLSRSWIQEEFVHLDELPAKLELPIRYSFRYVEIRVLDTSPKWQAVFSEPYVLAESAADEAWMQTMDKQWKNMKCAEDDSLRNIYEVSVKTLAECMQDVFEDGPKRDRRLWLGDLRLQALANYASFDQTDLVKRCLYLFAGMRTTEGKISANVFVKPKNVSDDSFLFDYSLFFVSVLHDYLFVHPEEELLKDLYPAAKRQIDLALEQVDEKGCLHLTEEWPVFVDWSNEFDKDTAGQAILIYVLKQFQVLAGQMEEENAGWYQKRLTELVQYAKTHLFDPEKNLFFSGSQREYNIASQVWMILADVFEEEAMNHRIMQETVRTLFPVRGIATPYMYHHIVEAMFQAKMPEAAVQLLKDYWGKMIELGADTFWEAFAPEDPDYSPYGSKSVNSYCHAWSCTPVYLMEKYLSRK